MGAMDGVVRRAQVALRDRRRELLRYVVPALRRARLLVPVWRLYERLVGLAGGGPARDERGVAIPPAYLRMLVAGSASADAFLASGRSAADNLRELFAAAGCEVERCGAVLDFGCGCGRVARWWPPGRTEWHACDVNPRLAAWCAAELRHLHVSTNPLGPPTGYRDGRFDAIYAVSVFTHWPETLQLAWMGELRRLLGDAGRLLFTTHGEAAATRVLLEDELARFRRGELVVRFGEDPGSNLCSAFHPPQWTRERLLAGAEVLLHRPGGAPGLGNQDIWVIA